MATQDAFTEFVVKAVNTDGFEIEFRGNPDQYAACTQWLADKDFGFKPAVKAKSEKPKSETGFACQFCGNEVEAYNDVKNGKFYSPAELSASRGKKILELGRGENAPCCAKCWTQAGHKAAWDKHYQGRK